MLRNLKIGSRLNLAFGFILSISLLLAIALAFTAHRAQVSLEKTFRNADEHNSVVSSARLALLSTAVAVRNMGLETKLEEVQKREKQALTARTQYLRERQKISSFELNDSESSLNQRLTILDKEFDSHFKEAVSQASQFFTDEAISIIAKQIDPLQEEANGLLLKIQESQRAVTERSINEVELEILAVNRIVLIVIALTLLSAAALAWGITRSITKPLSDAAFAVEKIGSGDLTFAFSSSGKDETADLLRGLESSRANLVEMVSNVRDGAHILDMASDEIASGNLDLSRRTESQASALEETAASMEELNSIVKRNSDAANSANLLAVTASEVATRGGDVVNQVVVTMKGINDSSQKISDIIGVIDGIAFQTNILALNAAVEAARAGEQGRGFAVVASEVRTLASRSATAAKEIKSLIGTSVERVEQGSKLVDTAGATMVEIVASINKVAALVGEISSASRDQSAGVSQIGEAVSSMDKVTQQNSALVEEMAASASGLKSQAQSLVNLVSQFKID